MSLAACKAAICSHCLYAIIDPETNEYADVISMLAANNQLTEEQLEQIIKTFDWFMEEVSKYEEINYQLLTRLKRIVPV